MNRITLLTVAVVVLYALFIEWMFGWAAILAGWKAVGLPAVMAALALLVATYAVRTHRMRDYFPRETAGRGVRLFRVVQVHNLLNIMLPFRAGETSFPVLMRAEFGIPLARGAAALVVLRLLDLHALAAAAGLGLVLAAPDPSAAGALWLAFLVLPLLLFPLRRPLLSKARRLLPQRLSGMVAHVEAGIPPDLGAFLRAWALTVVNWGVKVLVLAWVLGLMGVAPVAATFGGALGGELSSVLPVHAPAGVGTYPAGIAAGAAAFGGASISLDTLGRASVNTHLLMVVSALAGTGLALLLSAFEGRRPD
ncbi:lysylphosphatidylglycerol synthase domain-containing protein [Ensifer soli]|uniref:lysylphosphatidylglycerol synthase domain-containing protein n=1 Tax=Ciceribacter sp. sgz301302 TaxID=3342379 RepID=UPI0035B891B4